MSSKSVILALLGILILSVDITCEGNSRLPLLVATNTPSPSENQISDPETSIKIQTEKSPSEQSNSAQTTAVTEKSIPVNPSHSVAEIKLTKSASEESEISSKSTTK